MKVHGEFDRMLFKLFADCSGGENREGEGPSGGDTQIPRGIPFCEETPTPPQNSRIL